MTTIKELRTRIQRANDLLKMNERLRVARLKALDQSRIDLRRKHPELEEVDAS